MALQGQAGKKYGLIIQKRGEKGAPAQASSVFEKPPKPARPPPGASGFEHSSDSELERSDGEKDKEPQVQITGSKKLSAGDYLRLKVRSETQKDIDKALAEDPTCFQYDEVYDDISHTSTMQRAQAVNKTAERKPKYIEGLLATAEQRKHEYERRVERQIQKEREAEGAQFEDKEAFVTSGYREKLKQMKEDEERERAQETADAKVDVTRQGDLSMFYRNLLDQETTSRPKTGEAEPDKKPKNEEKNVKKDEEKRSARRASRSHSRSPPDRRQHHHRRSRSRSSSRHRSPERDRHLKKRRSRSRSPAGEKKPSPVPAPPKKEVAAIFEKRNADESAVLSAKERYLQRKMQRNLPTSDD